MYLTRDEHLVPKLRDSISKKGKSIPKGSTLCNPAKIPLSCAPYMCTSCHVDFTLNPVANPLSLGEKNIKMSHAHVHACVARILV
jgi:hypothetical protein